VVCGPADGRGRGRWWCRAPGPAGGPGVFSLPDGAGMGEGHRPRHRIFGSGMSADAAGLRDAEVAEPGRGQASGIGLGLP